MIKVGLLHHLISLIGAVQQNQKLWVEPPQLTQQLPNK